jgi:hypothetical protein
MATMSPSWMSDDTASASGTISAMRRAWLPGPRVAGGGGGAGAA